MHPVDVLMAVVMARQVRNGDWVSHGAAAPLAGAALYLALELHAPDVDFWIQGCVNPRHRDLADAIVAPQLTYASATAHMSQTEIIDFELRGLGLFQFLRPLQIDPFGNVNASMVERPDGSVVRFHGIAVADAINFVRRTCLYVTEHTPRVFTERLTYRTGTGHHDGSSWRSAFDIPEGGPDSVVTPLAVLGFDEGRRLEIRSLHPGVALDDVHTATGFELGVAAGLRETSAPTVEELEALDRVDPQGIRRLEFRDGRAEVQLRLDARLAGR